MDFFLGSKVRIVKALEKQSVKLNTFHDDLVKDNFEVSANGDRLHLAVALHVQSLVHVVLAEDAGLDTVTDQIGQFPDQAEMFVWLVRIIMNPLLHSGVSHGC